MSKSTTGYHNLLMSFLFRVRDLILDFLLPKSQRVLELEALSTDTLLEILPRAPELKDKYTMALFDYSHPLVKEVVWELKYKGNTRITDKLGEILYDVISHELGDLALFEKWERPILVPIPISDKRRFERGWNQSELLTERVTARDSERKFKYLPGQLVKIQHTESQTKTSSRSERLRNLTNSMKVLNASSVEGRCVILVDDVTTTGSTFAEARRALHACGVKKILCIAVAH
jgi:competence protein ComFC